MIPAIIAIVPLLGKKPIVATPTYKTCQVNALGSYINSGNTVQHNQRKALTVVVIYLQLHSVLKDGENLHHSNFDDLHSLSSHTIGE